MATVKSRRSGRRRKRAKTIIGKGVTISFTAEAKTTPPLGRLFGLAEFLDRPHMSMVKPGYEQLAEVLELALKQAQSGKGHERHAGKDEPFHEQQIVQLGEWMGQSPVFAIGQACKKAMESTRLDGERSEAELLGAINYIAAAILVNRRRRSCPCKDVCECKFPETSK